MEDIANTFPFSAPPSSSPSAQSTTGDELLAVEIAGLRRGDDFALARTPD